MALAIDGNKEKRLRTARAQIEWLEWLMFRGDSFRRLNNVITK